MFATNHKHNLSLTHRATRECECTKHTPSPVSHTQTQLCCAHQPLMYVCHKPQTPLPHVDAPHHTWMHLLSCQSVSLSDTLTQSVGLTTSDLQRMPLCETPIPQLLISVVYWWCSYDGQRIKSLKESKAPKFVHYKVCLSYVLKDHPIIQLATVQDKMMCQKLRSPAGRPQNSGDLELDADWSHAPPSGNLMFHTDRGAPETNFGVSICAVVKNICMKLVFNQNL